jgi:hypothetical protein
MLFVNRLSEDPNVTVGVLEAGGYHHKEPLVDVPGESPTLMTYIGFGDLVSIFEY